MWRAAAGALASHWRRRPGQALVLVLGIALATALWTGVQAINAEARASYDRAAALIAQNNRPVIRADAGGVPIPAYVALRRAGWSVAPVLEGRATLAGRSVTLIGLDPLSAPVLPGTDTPDEADGAEDDGAAGLATFVGPPGQLFTDPQTAARLAGGISAQVIASDDVAPGTAIGDLATVARLLGRDGPLDRLVLLDDPGSDLPPLEDVVPGLRIADPDTGADLRGLTGSFHLNLTAFGLLAFAVGLFIVHGAAGLAVEQRRGTVRTLRAIGLPARAVATLLGAELLAVALIAGALGVGLGYVIAALLLPDVAATLRGLYGAPASGELALRAGWIAAGFAMALLGTAVAAGRAIWALARLPVLAGAQPRAWAMAQGGGLRRQAVAGVAALVLAALAPLVAGGLTAGFAMLGGLLIGAALLLPPALARVLRWAEARAHGPLAQWFWADTRQQLPGLSLALMALMLALAANIGVSTMVGSFRATFAGWLDQRLAAEIYLDAGEADRAADIAAWLEPRVDAILPLASAPATIADRPGQVMAMADHATYRDAWPLLDAVPDVWDRLAAGDGVLINEQLFHRAGLGPGDGVTIDGDTLPVLGVYSDYGNPLAQAVLTHAAFVARYPDLPQTRFALRVASAEVPALVDALRDRFGLTADRMRDQTSLKALSQDIFEQTFAVTGALNLLTLGVAGVAIFTSLLTLADQRLPQLAPLWALGLTRARLARLELLRAGMLAALTAVLALPVGLVLAWMLLAVVNVEAFGWRLPMRLFPADWAGLALAAGLAAVLAAALPAWRLWRRPPAHLLGVFVHDR
ncbi:ABC transporter permease [Meridianimarinicoccus sp. RP-17]